MVINPSLVASFFRSPLVECREILSFFVMCHKTHNIVVCSKQQKHISYVICINYYVMSTYKLCIFQHLYFLSYKIFEIFFQVVFTFYSYF